MTNVVLIKRKQRERGKNVFQKRNILNLYRNENLTTIFVKFASHKHANSNSNAIGNSKTVSTIKGVSSNMKAVNLKTFPNYGRIYS